MSGRAPPIGHKLVTRTGLTPAGVSSTRSDQTAANQVLSGSLVAAKIVPAVSEVSLRQEAQRQLSRGCRATKGLDQLLNQHLQLWAHVAVPTEGEL